MIKILKDLANATGLARPKGLLHEGAAFPEFSLTDHLGQIISSENLKGKYSILWFYPIADTPG
jgi:peroxiredoxin